MVLRKFVKILPREFVSQLPFKPLSLLLTDLPVS